MVSRLIGDLLNTEPRDRSLLRKNWATVLLLVPVRKNLQLKRQFDALGTSNGSGGCFSFYRYPMTWSCREEWVRLKKDKMGVALISFFILKECTRTFSFDWMRALRRFCDHSLYVKRLEEGDACGVLYSLISQRHCIKAWKIVSLVDSALVWVYGTS